MKRFSIVQEGYDIGEVNRFIDIVVDRLEKLNAENASYLAKINKLTAEINDGDNISVNRLEKAILAVQDANDKIKEVAKEEAKIIVHEARNNANSIVHEALTKAEKIEHESMLLEKNMKVYKGRIKSLTEAQLKLLEDIDKIEL